MTLELLLRRNAQLLWPTFFWNCLSLSGHVAMPWWCFGTFKANVSRRWEEASLCKFLPKFTKMLQSCSKTTPFFAYKNTRLAWKKRSNRRFHLWKYVVSCNCGSTLSWMFLWLFCRSRRLLGSASFNVWLRHCWPFTATFLWTLGIFWSQSSVKTRFWTIFGPAEFPALHCPTSIFLPS